MVFNPDSMSVWSSASKNPEWVSSGQLRNSRFDEKCRYGSRHLNGEGAAEDPHPFAQSQRNRSGPICSPPRAGGRRRHRLRTGRPFFWMHGQIHFNMTSMACFRCSSILPVQRAIKLPPQRRQKHRHSPQTWQSMAAPKAFAGFRDKVRQRLGERAVAEARGAQVGQ